MSKHPPRIIGSFDSQHPGPLLLALGGMHGNEPAGVHAIERVLDLLKFEMHTKPKFVFSGRFVGIRGNLQALEKGQRFIERDLNRSLFADKVEDLQSVDIESLTAEDLEVVQLISCIKNEIASYLNPTQIILVDLHTTTASGGIFTLTTQQPQSIKIAQHLHAPVIVGFDDELEGTTLDYFNQDTFGQAITTVVFESGQHEDPMSVDRAVSALIKCMRSVGNVLQKDVEHKHDKLLIEYSKNLPNVARVLYRKHVEDSAQFEMIPEFQNFQPVTADEILAYENGLPVYALRNGMVLMPKYQQQGHDGFFIIESLEGY